MSVDRAEFKKIDNMDKGIVDITYLCLMSRNMQMYCWLSILLFKVINHFKAATEPKEMSLINISSLLYQDTEKMPFNI